MDKTQPKHSIKDRVVSFARAFPMSSIFSLDHEIVQLPDTVGVLWVYQTSQRNCVTIKVYYGYLRNICWVDTDQDWDFHSI